MAEIRAIEYRVTGPKHYRLRHTVSGGVELLGGYECTRYVGGEPRGTHIEWRVLPTLAPGELPEDA